MSDITNRQKLEQGRASHAFTAAKLAKSTKEEHIKEALSASQREEYHSYAKKLPMMIQTNGLGACLAFMYSKSEGQKGANAYKTLYKNISNWLVTQRYLAATEELVEKVINYDSSEYRAITNEVLAYLNWLRRFA